MAEHREPRHKRMYKKSPKLERDENGRMESKRPSDHQVDADKEQAGVDGMKMEEHHDEHGHSHARRAMHHRHLHEHMMLHHHHEIEHSHHAGGHKGAMHDKHEAEYAEMHHRHHHEMKKLHESHEKEVEHGEKKDMYIKENKAGEKAEKKE